MRIGVAGIAPDGRSQISLGLVRQAKRASADCGKIQQAGLRRRKRQQGLGQFERLLELALLVKDESALRGGDVFGRGEHGQSVRGWQLRYFIRSRLAVPTGCQTRMPHRAHDGGAIRGDAVWCAASIDPCAENLPAGGGAICGSGLAGPRSGQPIRAED